MGDDLLAFWYAYFNFAISGSWCMASSLACSSYGTLSGKLLGEVKVLG